MPSVLQHMRLSNRNVEQPSFNLYRCEPVIDKSVSENIAFNRQYVRPGFA